MGCYPLRVIVSKALGKCNGRERWMEDQRMDYAMAYPPGPHPETLYMRPVARTVTFSGTNSVHMIPPTPPPPQQQQHPEHQPQAPPPQHEHQPPPEQPAPAPEQGAPPPEQPAPAPEQGAPPPEQPRQPKRGKKKPPRRVRFGPEPPPPEQQQQQQEHQEQQQQQQQPEHAPNSNPGNGAPGHHGQQGRGPPGYLRYTPSPLPRWEATPRRHEYFSGEYRYSYPTPVREGIYSMATDANRLTTIFSEENPNACTIV